MKLVSKRLTNTQPPKGGFILGQLSCRDDCPSHEVLMNIDSIVLAWLFIACVFTLLILA